jgi:hypothetical protein
MIVPVTTFCDRGNRLDAILFGQLVGLLIILAFYHISEYCIHKKIHPGKTDFTSFLITPGYLAAFSLGYTEYAIQRYFFPFKSDPRSPFIWKWRHRTVSPVRSDSNS